MRTKKVAWELHAYDLGDHYLPAHKEGLLELPSFPIVSPGPNGGRAL